MGNAALSIYAIMYDLVRCVGGGFQGIAGVGMGDKAYEVSSGKTAVGEGGSGGTHIF